MDSPIQLSDVLAPSNHELSLPQEALEQLKTPQDYESAFATVAEQLNDRYWWIADLILSYSRKFPKFEMDIYRNGQQMSQSASRYYLRTAAAFPPNTRIPSLTFSHHYAASWADQFNRKPLTYTGRKRFEYLNKAADESLSSRALTTLIGVEKTASETGITIYPCVHCDSSEETQMYKIYKHFKPRVKPSELWLHSLCYEDILNYANRVL